MKKTIIIAAAAAAGAMITYMMRRMKANKQVLQPNPSRRSHHRTDVFAHAKNHTV